VFTDAEGLQLCGSRLRARRVVATIQVGGDRQAGLSFGGANEAEDFLVAVERLAGPVFGDLREQTMLDGIPLGQR